MTRAFTLPVTALTALDACRGLLAGRFSHYFTAGPKALPGWRAARHWAPVVA